MSEPMCMTEFAVCAFVLAPNNQILPCLVKGALVGAATAVVVGTVATLAAPVVGAGVVSAALFAGAVYGGYTLYKDISSNYSSGNTAGLAYDAGSLLGGAAVGYFRGGATANGIKPGASSGWSLSRDISNRFKPSLGLNPLTWFGTGPDAGAAGGAQAAAGQAVPRRGC